jgi:long-chain acyl-CoA synthetase
MVIRGSTLSPEEIDKFVQSAGLQVNGGQVARHPEIQKMIKKVIDENNKKLPSYETIKRFAILDHELTEEAGEVTPSLKVKRRFVVKKYATILDRLYEESQK